MAERQILTGKDQIPKPAETAWRSLRRRLFSPRALVWSAAAVAVAVTLMVTDRDQRQQPADDRPVAMVTETGEEAAPAASIGPAPDSREKRGKDLAADKSGAAEPAEPTEPAEPAEVAGEKAAGDKFAEAPVTTEDGGRALASKTEPAREAALGSAPPADQPAPEKLMAKKAAGGPLMEKPSAGKLAGAPAPAAPAVPPPAADPGPGGTFKDDYDPKPKHGRGSGVGGGAYASRTTADGRQDWGGRLAQSAGVVVLDCSAQAAREDAFNKVLAANGLAWDQTQVHAKDTGYVVATPERIEATLDDLYGQRQSFPALSVEPAPGVEHWKRYNRAVEKQQLAVNGVQAQRPGAGEARPGEPAPQQFKSKTPAPAKRGARERSDADRPAKSPLSRLPDAGQTLDAERDKMAKTGLAQQPAATPPKPSQRPPQAEPQQPPGAQSAARAQEEPEGKRHERQQAQQQDKQRRGRKSEQKQGGERPKQPEQPKQAPKYRVLFVLRVVPLHVNIPSAAAAIKAADRPNAAAPPAALMELQAKPPRPADASAPDVTPDAKK